VYSKVTHDIVEEYFDAVGSKPMLIPTEILPGAELPPAVMNEATLVFRMDSRSLWAKYAWSLLNYSISMNAELPGTSQVESRLLRVASSLGDFITPYYGIVAGQQLSEKLAGIAKVGTQFVDAVKDRRDLTEFQNIWNSLIEDLAEFMHSLNPTQWPKVLLVEMFGNLVTTWARAIQARYNQDWNRNEEAIDDLNTLVVTGIANHVNKGYSSIADVFSRGIIAQYPSLFVK
jgi:hypothetical protein